MPQRTTNQELQRRLRREITRRHARLTSSGLPKFCHGSTTERAQRAGVGLKPLPNLIIYDTLEAAQAAADEMQKLDGRPQWAFPCPRSRSGHAHLSLHPPREQENR